MRRKREAMGLQEFRSGFFSVRPLHSNLSPSLLPAADCFDFLQVLSHSSKDYRNVLNIQDILEKLREAHNMSSQMPIDLVLVRHGQSEGNLAQAKSKKGDDSFWTGEFSQRPSSMVPSLAPRSLNGHFFHCRTLVSLHLPLVQAGFPLPMISSCVPIEVCCISPRSFHFSFLCFPRFGNFA